jgi:hypothetical protein
MVAQQVNIPDVAIVPPPWQPTPLPPTATTKLRMYVDYLRGRCIKTTVEVASDGNVRLETVNRGKAALTWVAKLQGKKLLQAAPPKPP